MFTWIMAIVLGLLTSVLYIGHYYGLSVFVMTVLFILVTYVYKKQAGLMVGRHFYLISGYMILLSPVFFVTTVGVIRFWSGIILVILLLTLAICEEEFRWPKWLVASLSAFFGGMARMPLLVTHGKSLSSEGKKQVAYVMLGFLIALPILAVAGGLLASADAVMAEYIEQILDGIEFDDGGIWVRRILSFIFVSSLSFGYSRWFVDQKAKEVASELPSGKTVELIPAAVSGTILFLLNILYVLFAYVQIRFLFFGGGQVVPGAYDYAHYARSGFFELVTLSVLNTIGILVINRFTKVHLFNEISLTITALSTFVMIASSWFKMHLYEQAYGYTQLRLYVYMILAFMAVFMALITLGIWKKTYRVIEWSIVIGLVYFLLISYVNVDQIIVENNVAKYERDGELDWYYLTTSLSEDAVPYVIEAVESNSMLVEEAVSMGYYEDYLKYKVDLEETRWFFEYNLRHERAVRGILSVE